MANFKVEIKVGTALTKRGEKLTTKQEILLPKLESARKQFNVWVQLSLDSEVPVYISLVKVAGRELLADFQIKAKEYETLDEFKKRKAWPDPMITKPESKRSAFGVGKRDKPVDGPHTRLANAKPKRKRRIV